MGIRIDLKAANWLAYLIESDIPLPEFENPSNEKKILSAFLKQLLRGFRSSPYREKGLIEHINETEIYLSNIDKNLSRISPQLILMSLRDFFSERPWTSLIIPSGDSSDLDRLINSEQFLGDLVSIDPESPGIILQIEGPLDEITSLTNVFPAFRTALTNSTQWPGILLWTRRGDSMFFPLPKNVEGIKYAASWIYLNLYRKFSFDLVALKKSYLEEFSEIATPKSSVCHFIQISDLHLGSKEQALGCQE